MEKQETRLGIGDSATPLHHVRLVRLCDCKNMQQWTAREHVQSSMTYASGQIWAVLWTAWQHSHLHTCCQHHQCQKSRVHAFGCKEDSKHCFASCPGLVSSRTETA